MYKHTLDKHHRIYNKILFRICISYGRNHHFLQPYFYSEGRFSIIVLLQVLITSFHFLRLIDCSYILRKSYFYDKQIYISCNRCSCIEGSWILLFQHLLHQLIQHIYNLQLDNIKGLLNFPQSILELNINIFSRAQALYLINI
jgi:hypothetical protein